MLIGKAEVTWGKERSAGVVRVGKERSETRGWIGNENKAAQDGNAWLWVGAGGAAALNAGFALAVLGPRGHPGDVLAAGDNNLMKVLFRLTGSPQNRLWIALALGNLQPLPCFSLKRS